MGGSSSSTADTSSVTSSAPSASRSVTHKKMSSHSQPRTFTTIGNIQVSIVRGSFVNEKADVLVNCTSASLDLTQGRGAKAVAEKAGPAVQTDLDNKYSNDISEGEVAVSVPGNLKCRNIYHICLSKWNQNDTQGLKKVLTNCLVEAAKFKVKSIVFPSLGTGYLGYPPNVVIKTSVQAIEEFSQNNGTSSIKNIVFAVYDKKRHGVFDVFVQEMRSYCPSGAAGSVTAAVSTTRYTVQFGQTTVRVVLGTLSQQRVDVIVNSAPSDLNLTNGGLSEALVRVAGQSLQDECDNEYPNGISGGEILTTRGYNLPCSYMYHGCLPDWANTNSQQATQDLHDFMTGCLEEASSHQTTSMAFPTLGTGSLNFPCDVTAKTMINCLQEFVKDRPNTSLRNIRIVIYDQANGWQAVEKAFRSECQPLMSQGQFPSPPKQTPVAVPVTTPVTMATQPPRQPPPKGTTAYFNYMYEKDTVSPNYWTKYDNRKLLKVWNTTLSPNSNTHAVFIPVSAAVHKSIETVVQKSWIAHKFGKGQDAQGLSQLGYSQLNVVKVERVENPVLFDKYAKTRAHLFWLAAKKGKAFTPIDQIACGSHKPLLTTTHSDANLGHDMYSEVNECYVFHGTPADRVDIIADQGLDNRLAGNAQLGKAVYTAESSTKSDQYADMVGHRDKTNEKKMFLTRMCLGEPYILDTKPAAGITFVRPPCKTCKNDKCADGSHDGYFDSMVVENFWIFREFVVFEKDRCYPEYLITYKRV